MRGVTEEANYAVPRVRKARVRAIVLAGLLLSSGGANAQQRGDGAGAPARGEEPAAHDSPRASLALFLDLCRAGRYAEAARHLELAPSEAGRGQDLARRLKAVLDQHVWFDLESISPSPEGSRDDGLPPELEEIAQIPGPVGGTEPVRLVRREEGEPRWVFSRPTVSRIDPWYQRLEHHWMHDHLPGWLLKPGPRELLYWQWLALPVLLLVAWGIGYLLSAITRRLLVRVAARTRARWDDELVARVSGPLTLAWGLVVAYLLLPSLALYQPAHAFIDRILRAVFLVVLFWALVRSVDVGRKVIAESPWTRDHPASRSLLPLGARVAKVVVVAIGAVALLSELGYPVASLVAGLGIGGLALALAAQKTVENLFGAFSIGADQPFREGDFVRIEDFVGNVESIGLRSTRIRTLDRTLISIPNGRLAEMRLESFTARDRIRLACTIGVVYGTTASQMREVLAGLERVLREHPKIWPDAVVVRFKEFGASSLDVEVMAWFQTSDFTEFGVIRQDVLLQFMEVVEKAGSSFAFPTSTVHVVNEKG